jgi:hypothetical protein
MEFKVNQEVKVVHVRTINTNLLKSSGMEFIILRLKHNLSKAKPINVHIDRTI